MAGKYPLATRAQSNKNLPHFDPGLTQQMFICCAVVGDRVRSPYVYIYMLGSSDSDSQRVSEPSSLLILAARLSFASPTHILCIVRCCVVSPLAYYYFIVSALLASALE